MISVKCLVFGMREAYSAKAPAPAHTIHFANSIRFTKLYSLYKTVLTLQNCTHFTKLYSLDKGLFALQNCIHFTKLYVLYKSLYPHYQPPEHSLYKRNHSPTLDHNTTPSQRGVSHSSSTGERGVKGLKVGVDCLVSTGVLLDLP